MKSLVFTLSLMLLLAGVLTPGNAAAAFPSRNQPRIEIEPPVDIQGGVNVLPLVEDYLVSWSGKGERCFVDKRRAHSFARFLRDYLGCDVKLKRLNGQYCVSYHCKSKNRVYQDLAKARRVAQFLRGLGFRTSLRRL